MTYSEKYEITKKTFMKKTDLMRLLGTNNNYFNPYWEEMIRTLEKKVGHSFGPWGVPKQMCLDYFGIDLEDLKRNAEEEKKLNVQFGDQH